MRDSTVEKNLYSCMELERVVVSVLSPSQAAGEAVEHVTLGMQGTDWNRQMDEGNRLEGQFWGCGA